jgi:hypothetical protein
MFLPVAFSMAGRMTICRGSTLPTMAKGGRLTMSDDELIQAVADLWVENGGDAEGFEWVQRRIREEIERREEAS